MHEKRENLFPIFRPKPTRVVITPMFTELEWTDVADLRELVIKCSAESARVSLVEADLLLQYFHYKPDLISRFGID